MLYKELRLLFIDITKWEALSERLNIEDAKRKKMTQAKLVLKKAILIEREKLSALELNIANQSIKNHNVVEGTLASTNQTMDTQAILALTENDNNNQQEVELIIDFNPSWIFIFEQNKTGLSTIKQFETTGKTLPFDCVLDAAAYNLELGKGYKAVAYAEHPNENKNTLTTSFPFIYNGNQEILVQVMNKKSQELEELLDENDKHYKQTTKKREQIQLLLNEKHNFILQTTKDNTTILIEDFCDFCNTTLAYPSISGSLDTQRKLVGSASSSFVQIVLVESGKKLVNKAQSVGVIAASTRTGASIGGIYGAIIGFGAGIVIDILVNKGVEAYILDATEDLTYKARRQKIDAILSKKKTEWYNEAEKKLQDLFHSINNTTTTIFNNESIEELNAIHKELKKYKEKTDKPIIKGAYFKELLKNWVFTNAGDSDDSNVNVQDKDIWQENLEKLFELGELKESDCDIGPAIRYQPDVYLYQLKGVLAIMGISCGLIDALTKNHNTLTVDIRNRLINPSSSSGLEKTVADDCQAYDTYYDEIRQKMSFTFPSNEIKVQDKKAFVDFFKFNLDASNENFGGIISTILTDFMHEGTPFTLYLEIELKKDASSVFFSSLRWFISKPNMQDTIKGVFSYD